MMVDSRRALVVEDDRFLLQILTTCLEQAGWTTVGCRTAEAAQQALAAQTFDVVICDFELAGGSSGAEVLGHVRTRAPSTDFVLITGHGPVVLGALAEEAVVVHKPFSVDELLAGIDAASARRRVD